MRRQDEDSLYELSTTILNVIRSSPSAAVRSRRLPEITPAGFAWMLLGISLGMMLGGSVTFFIGFLLLPWVLGLVMVLYVVGIVPSFTMILRLIFSGCSSSGVDFIQKEGSSAWKLL